MDALPSLNALNSPVKNSSAMTGYELEASLMQNVKAFNAINNDGEMVVPSFQGSPVGTEAHNRVLPPFTANYTKYMLMGYLDASINTATNMEGFEVGGYEGLAHIKENGRYVEKYNATFLGFVNRGEQKYTIGIVAFNLKAEMPRGPTVMPVFKDIIDLMLDEGLLSHKDSLIKHIESGR
jgi:cell division protein FtsI (penicillin-binding protein 3)